MTFDDPWLDENLEALDQICLLEVPIVTAQTSADGWGLGNVPSGDSNVTNIPLHCMEVPQRVFLDRTNGITQAVTLGLVIEDPNDDVQESRRVTFQDRRYQIRMSIEPIQHNLKRVLLDEIGPGGN
jgi:hypothetical protein